MLNCFCTHKFCCHSLKDTLKNSFLVNLQNAFFKISYCFLNSFTNKMTRHIAVKDITCIEIHCRSPYLVIEMMFNQKQGH